MTHVTVFNPNSDPGIAARMVGLISAKCPGLRTTGISNHGAPAYLDTPEALHAALEPALARLAACDPRPDLLLIACFSDVRSYMSEASLRATTLSIADCSIAVLGSQKRPFSIMTGGRAWLDPIRKHVASLGMSQLLASVRGWPRNSASLMRAGTGERQEFEALLEDCISRDGASTVLLAGGGFVGRSPYFKIAGKGRVVDCGECTADLLQAFSARRHGKEDGEESGLAHVDADLPAPVAKILRTAMDTAR